jgi:hypothetical protein
LELLTSLAGLIPDVEVVVAGGKSLPTALRSPDSKRGITWDVDVVIRGEPGRSTTLSISNGGSIGIAIGVTDAIWGICVRRGVSSCS